MTRLPFRQNAKLGVIPNRQRPEKFPSIAKCSSQTKPPPGKLPGGFL